MRNRNCISAVALLLSLAAWQHAVAKEGVIRAGIVGCDTSHVDAFTKLINDPDATGPFADVEVVAAFPGGSPDIPKESIGSRARLRQEAERHGHQNRRLARRTRRPVRRLHARKRRRPPPPETIPRHRQRQTSLRRQTGRRLARRCAHDLPHRRRNPHARLHLLVAPLRQRDPSRRKSCRHKDKAFGDLLGCETESPMSTESHHPDLFWYGIHGVEPLYTIMGTGCDSVSRTDSPLSTVVVGKWKDGRLGSYRGLKKGYYYSFTAYRHQESHPRCQVRRLRTGRRRHVRVLQDRQAARSSRRNDRNLRLHGSRRRQQESRRQTGHDRRHHRTSQKEIGRSISIRRRQIMTQLNRRNFLAGTAAATVALATHRTSRAAALAERKSRLRDHGRQQPRLPTRHHARQTAERRNRLHLRLRRKRDRQRHRRRHIERRPRPQRHQGLPQSARRQTRRRPHLRRPQPLARPRHAHRPRRRQARLLRKAGQPHRRRRRTHDRRRARSSDRVLQIGLQRRSNPHYRTIIDKVREGAIGRVLYAKSTYYNNRPSIGHGKANRAARLARLRPLARPRHRPSPIATTSSPTTGTSSGTGATPKSATTASTRSTSAAGPSASTTPRKSPPPAASSATTTISKRPTRATSSPTSTAARSSGKASAGRPRTNR